MEETAIIDATSQISDTSIDTPDLDTTSDETSIETTDTDTSVEGGDGEAGGEQTATSTIDEPAISGTKLSTAAKTTLDEIRKTNPKLAAELKSALFEREAIRAALPGGVKEFNEFKSKLEAVGGFEGIESLRAETSDWNALDQRFTTGDPAFIDEIAEASPEAFAKLAPAAFAKFQQVSPDGFSKYIAGIFQADMAQSGLLMSLERLGDFLPTDNPRVTELFGNIIKYTKRVGTLANQEVKPLAKKDTQAAPELDSERAKFNQEREEFTRNQWGTEAGQGRVKTFNDAFAKETQGLKLTTEQTAAVKELYASRMISALKAAGFNETADKFFKAGDKAGYLRYAESVYKAQIPNALKAALTVIAPGKKPGPKAAAPGQKTNAPAGKTTATPGFEWTTSAPKTGEINWALTDRNMIKSGKAILFGGRKVQWKRV